MVAMNPENLRVRGGRKASVLPARLRCRFMNNCFGPSHTDFHVDPRPKPIDDRNEAIDSEPPEVRIPDARKVGRCNPRSTMRCAHGQVFPIKHLNDFGGQAQLIRETPPSYSPVGRLKSSRATA